MKNKGFTLVELIVGLAILSVVIAISYNTINFASTVAKRKTEESDGRKALRLIIEQVTRDIQSSTDVDTTNAMVTVGGQSVKYSVASDKLVRNINGKTTAFDGVKNTFVIGKQKEGLYKVSVGIIYSTSETKVESFLVAQGTGLDISVGENPGTGGSYDSEFILGSVYYHQGGRVNGCGSTMLANSLEMLGHGGQYTAVTNIYIRNGIELKGSQSLGCPSIPGDIIVGGDSIIDSSNTSYGNYYSHGSMIVRNTHRFMGDVYVDKTMAIGNGTTIDGDLYINGTLELDGRHSLRVTGSIYIAGEITGEINNELEVGGEIVRTPNKAELKPIPDVVVPSPRSPEWYSAYEYVSTGLQSNTNIYHTGDYTFTRPGGVYSDVILVVINGDARIDLSFWGGSASSFTGLIYVPDGKATILAREFTGVVIARDGVYFTGNSNITVNSQNINEIIPTSENYPFY